MSGVRSRTAILPDTGGQAQGLGMGAGGSAPGATFSSQMPYFQSCVFFKAFCLLCLFLGTRAGLGSSPCLSRASLLLAMVLWSFWIPRVESLAHIDLQDSFVQLKQLCRLGRPHHSDRGHMNDSRPMVGLLSWSSVGGRADYNFHG